MFVFGLLNWESQQSPGHSGRIVQISVQFFKARLACQFVSEYKTDSQPNAWITRLKTRWTVLQCSSGCWIRNWDKKFHSFWISLIGLWKPGPGWGTRPRLTLTGFTGIPGRSDEGVATALILAEPISCSSVPACSSFFSASCLLPRTSPMASAPVAPN